MPGHPDDEAYHAQVHAEYLSGPEIPVIRMLSPCAADGPLPIYVVDRTCPKEIRHSLSHIAIVACRSMPGYPAGYDGSVTDEDPRLYLAADGAHLVAMVLTGLDDRFWRFAWKNEVSLTLVEPVASTRRSPKIARAWTAASYRRRGLALQLIQTAGRHLPCDIAELGWELPFTPGGACLVKSLCPDVFWGCGDKFSLRKPLQVAPA